MCQGVKFVLSYQIRSHVIQHGPCRVSLRHHYVSVQGRVCHLITPALALLVIALRIPGRRHLDLSATMVAALRIYRLLRVMVACGSSVAHTCTLTCSCIDPSTPVRRPWENVLKRWTNPRTACLSLLAACSSSTFRLCSRYLLYNRSFLISNFLELRLNVFKQRELSQELIVISMLDCPHQLTVPTPKPVNFSPCDLTITGQLPQADRTKREWLLVCLSDQVWAIHEALVVRTVSHSKNMADLMASCFQIPIQQDICFLWPALCTQKTKSVFPFHITLHHNKT